MLTKKQNLTREILTVILLLAAVAATEYWFFQLWRLDWHVPMFYGGDGIYWVGQVQRSYGELSGSLGWPFYEVAGRYDPNYDLIYDIFVWFVGLFTKDTGTVFNLYVQGGVGRLLLGMACHKGYLPGYFDCISVSTHRPLVLPEVR